MKITTTGFMIVELLIVMVVIAMLAAMSIVAYTGMQARANDSRRMHDVAAMRKALSLCKADHGGTLRRSQIQEVVRGRSARTPAF